MKAIFSAVQLGHKPERFLSRGHIVDYPDKPERVRILLDGARGAGAEVHAARTFDDQHIAAVHKWRYLEFLEKAHKRWHRPKGAFNEVMPSARPVEQPARYPRSIMGRAGWHMTDFSCPIVADTWKVARASADTALTAAAMVAEGEPVVYALCRPPGHHAYQERAGGFCYLNNTAIAAQYMRNSYDRVAILDIDVHHGNGTQGIFYKRDDVLTVSVHSDPKNFYPFFYGYDTERGNGPGRGYNFNIPLPLKSEDDVWAGAIEYAVELINEFAPGALVVALGLDAHESDPLKGGAVTTPGFAHFASIISKLELPTVLVQEGGYMNDALGDNLVSFLKGMSAVT
ncbi:MAG: histone deacetylase family protein [Hyphomicrobiales bacterium]|nr:histone deacetylase family protein [Hyphomicrobiales bacterium]